MNNITYAIKTCIKYEDKLRTCLDTWAFEQDVVLSTDLTETDLVEKYDSLTRKSRRFFGTTTFKPGNWLLYCDDDTFVNVRALEKYVETLDPRQVVVVGRGCMPCTPKTKRAIDTKVNNLRQIPRHTLFQGGAGTLMSYPACLIVQLMIWTDRAPATDLFLAEDQWVTATVRAYADMMGTYLGQKQTIRVGGKKEEEERFQTLFNERNVERVASGEALTLHHVVPADMYRIHDLVLDTRRVELAKS